MGGSRGGNEITKGTKEMMKKTKKCDEDAREIIPIDFQWAVCTRYRKMFQINLFCKLSLNKFQQYVGHLSFACSIFATYKVHCTDNSMMLIPSVEFIVAMFSQKHLHLVVNSPDIVVYNSRRQISQKSDVSSGLLHRVVW